MNERADGGATYRLPETCRTVLFAQWSYINEKRDEFWAQKTPKRTQKLTVQLFNWMRHVFEFK